MCYCPVVANTANGIHQHGNDEDQAEHAARSNASGLMRLSLRASVDRTSLEEVCAFVWVGADKRDGRLRISWFAVAQEGNNCRLSPCLAIALARACLERLNFVWESFAIVVFSAELATALV